MTKLGDFDIWFKVCKCGFDNAKGTKRSSGKCWRCGSKLARDYSDRALKNMSLRQKNSSVSITESQK